MVSAKSLKKKRMCIKPDLENNDTKREQKKEKVSKQAREARFHFAPENFSNVRR